MIRTDKEQGLVGDQKYVDLTKLTLIQSYTSATAPRRLHCDIRIRKKIKSVIVCLKKTHFGIGSEGSKKSSINVF